MGLICLHYQAGEKHALNVDCSTQMDKGTKLCVKTGLIKWIRGQNCVSRLDSSPTKRETFLLLSVMLYADKICHTTGFRKCIHVLFL